MKKVFSILLAIMIVANISVRSSYAAPESEFNGIINEECQTNDISSDNNIIESVMEDLYSAFDYGDEGYIFPECYGGCYLSEDGTLVVLSNDISQLKNEFNILYSADPSIELSEVAYSRNELQDIGDSYSDTFSDYYTYYVDEKLNKVVFTASETVCDEHNRIVEEKGLPIVFKTGTRVNNDITMRPSKLLGSSVGYFSSGAVANDANGNNYIISCGHEQTVGDVISFNGERIGVVKSVRYANNQTGDYSIIKLDSGNSISCLVKFGSGTEYLEAVGDMSWTNSTGYMQGGYSSNLGYAPFSLSAINITINSGGVKIKGMVSGEVDPSTNSGIAVNGDSGSPIYFYDESTNDFTFAGIYSGHNWQGDYKYIYFTPQSALPSSYTVYTL